MNKKQKLCELPLGTRFRYFTPYTGDVFVLLDRSGRGTVADDPQPERRPRALQGIYGGAHSPEEFNAVEVYVAPPGDEELIQLLRRADEALCFATPHGVQGKHEAFRNTRIAVMKKLESLGASGRTS